MISKIIRNLYIIADLYSCVGKYLEKLIDIF